MTNKHDLLLRLLDAPGPSGFETAPARVWRDEAAGFAESVEVDTAGNSIASLNSRGKRRVMFAGHIDEIGVMVRHIDDKGFLSFGTIGGWDSQVFVGQRVTILTRQGPIPGVIGKKAVHLMKTDEREQGTRINDLWIDIGARTQKEAQKMVRVGDPGVISAGAVQLPHDRIVSRSLDNRIGAYVVLEALRLLSRRKPAAAVYSVATAREEIAWTGGGARTSATGIEPDVAVVVDVTHATDHPNVEARHHGEVKLGAGPVLSRGSSVHPLVFELLADTAATEKIPVQLAAAPIDTGTDADAIHSSLRGVPTGLVSVPLRYMHSPNELVELSDVERAAKLLAAFARRITAATDFRPV